MRVFIALDLPSFIKERIANIEADLKKCNLNAKWVNPNNLHFTLKFLGDIKEEIIEDIKNIIEDVASKFNSLEIYLKEFGFFPNEKIPRVFFINTDQRDILKNISQYLEEKLAIIGFEKEERFKSHITLARIKSPKNIDSLKSKMKNIIIEESFLIHEIILFKSTLTKDGAIYEEIFKASLRDKE